MRAEFDLDGRVAVVTGGGRGVGRAIAAGTGRVGAAVFLALPASAYVTGQSLLVDGGWTAQ